MLDKIQQMLLGLDENFSVCIVLMECSVSSRIFQVRGQTVLLPLGCCAHAAGFGMNIKVILKYEIK